MGTLLPRSHNNITAAGGRHREESGPAQPLSSDPIWSISASVGRALHGEYDPVRTVGQLADRNRSEHSRNLVDGYYPPLCAIGTNGACRYPRDLGTERRPVM